MNDEKIWLETEDGQKLFIIKTEKCDMQKELTETIDYLQQELQRKDNIINELKEYINNIDDNEHSFGDYEIDYRTKQELLDKLEELKEK